MRRRPERQNFVSRDIENTILIYSNSHNAEHCFFFSPHLYFTETVNLLSTLCYFRLTLQNGWELHSCGLLHSE